jgi:MFS family permease
MFVIAASGVYAAAAVRELDGMKYIGLIFTLESLARTLVIPAAGKLGDRCGRKPLYIISVAAYGGAALMCGAAGRIEVFLAGRILMGFTWGLFFSNMFVMVADVYDRETCPRMMGYLQAVNMAAMLIAAPVMGVLCDAASWRVVFYACIPFLVASAALVAKAMPEGRRAVTAPADVAGILCMAAAVVPLSLALAMGGARYPWISAPILSMLAASAVAVVCLVFAEKKAENPVFPGAILADRNYMLVLAVASLHCIVSSVLNYLPAFSQMVAGTSATVSGFLSFPGWLLGAFAAPLIGAWIAKKNKYRGILAQWLLLTVAACVMYLFFGSSTPVWFLVAAVTLAGLAQSCNQVAPVTYPSSVLSPSLVASGIAFISFTGSLSNTIGSAVFGAVVNTGLQNIFKVPLVFAALMIPAVLVFRDR